MLNVLGNICTVVTFKSLRKNYLYCNGYVRCSFKREAHLNIILGYRDNMIVMPYKSLTRRRYILLSKLILFLFVDK